MAQIQKMKNHLVIGNWSLGFVSDLNFVIWIRQLLIGPSCAIFGGFR